MLNDAMMLGVNISILTQPKTRMLIDKSNPSKNNMNALPNWRIVIQSNQVQMSFFHDYLSILSNIQFDYFNRYGQSFFPSACNSLL